jgi:uncharacterized circularly permuted ATP-grasp superfamily protein
MGSEPIPFTEGFREERDDSGGLRPGYEELFDAFAGVDLSELRDAVEEHLEQNGVSFGGDPFVVDPVPRLLSSAEWANLADGLAQRTRALNGFLRDAYGPQRIVDEGVVPSDTILEAEGFEAHLRGRLPGHSPPAGILGFDVVRDPEGEFLVLEDNLRTPSGYAYALAAREALLALLPAGCPRPQPIDPVGYELIRRALVAAAPGGIAAPSIIVLTDGPDNVAYYEHKLAADRLGLPLVTVADLAVDGDDLLVTVGDGDARRVEVVYRRTDEDRAYDERGVLTDVGKALLPAWLSGRIGIVNAFGNGVGDDKLVHGHVEDFIRFYLDEEPKLRSVPTVAVGQAASPAEAIDRLRELVVKPRHGHGGKGVVVGAHAEEEDLASLAEELERNPERYISQPTVALSRHPTVIDGRLEPRHVDLRAFAFSFSDDEVALLPGGLSRVAMQADALVVNSSQDGGGKDTWVLD